MAGTTNYPGALDTWTDKVDGVDDNAADDVNDAHARINAVQAELGTNPSGSAATVAARIAALEGGSGTIADGAVTTAKLANGAVTAAKVAADVATQAELDAAISGLSGTYEPLGGAFSSFRQALAAGYSASMGVIGDSTGSGVTRWVALLAADLAARYPLATVQYRNFTTGTTTYDTAPVVTQTGAAGARYVSMNGTTLTGLSTPTTTQNAIVGNLDIRTKIRPTSWAPGTGNTKTIAAKWGVGATRGWLFQLQNNGIPMLQWTADGNTIVGPWPATAAVPFTDGNDGWVRVTLNCNNAGNYQVTFYTSTDGVTWTILGAARNGTGTTSVAALPAQQLELGSRGNGGAEPFGGRIYTVEIRDGIAGPIVAPVLPDLWAPVNSNWDATFTGAPVIDIWNGSWSGAALGGQLIPNVAQLNPSAGLSVVVVNDSHNEGGKDPIEFAQSLDTLTAAIRARNPLAGIVLSGQNPKTTPGQAQYLVDAHAKRQIALPGYARSRGYGFTDVYSRFNASGLGLGALVQVDGTHPTDAQGCPLWEASVAALFTAS